MSLDLNKIKDFGGLAGASVALAALAFTIFHSRVQRRQHQLQEAEAYRHQAAAWVALSEHWEIAMLAAAGSDSSRAYGVRASTVTEFLEVVDRYRLARTGFLPFQDADEVSSDDYDRYLAEMGKVEGELLPYQRSVERVVTHLAQVSGLVLRGRLSLDVAYDALGTQVIRLGDNLHVLIRESYAHKSSCPGPLNAELLAWKNLRPEAMAGRIGWGNFLDVARSSAERIAVFLDLLTFHALKVGDIGPHATHPEYMQPPGSQLADSDRLARAWRVARRVGRFKAIRTTRRFSAAGRKARRTDFWYYPRWLTKLLDKASFYPHRFVLPHNGFVRAPLDWVLVPIDVLLAAMRSRKIPDIRQPEEPDTHRNRVEGRDRH